MEANKEGVKIREKMAVMRETRRLMRLFAAGSWLLQGARQRFTGRS